MIDALKAVREALKMVADFDRGLPYRTKYGKQAERALAALKQIEAELQEKQDTIDGLAGDLDHSEAERDELRAALRWIENHPATMSMTGWEWRRAIRESLPNHLRRVFAEDAQ